MFVDKQLHPFRATAGENSFFLVFPIFSRNGKVIFIVDYVSNVEGTSDFYHNCFCDLWLISKC